VDHLKIFKIETTENDRPFILEMTDPNKVPEAQLKLWITSR
jgi:hypothetical protein